MSGVTVQMSGVTGYEFARRSVEETLLNLNRFQLTNFHGDDICQSNMDINSVSPASGPCLSSVVLLKKYLSP